MSIVDKIVLVVELDLSRPIAANAAQQGDDAAIAAQLAIDCGTDAGRIEFIGFAPHIIAQVTRHSDQETNDVTVR